MQSSKLPPLIDITGFPSHQEKINYLNGVFVAEFLDKVKRPQLFGKFIYVDTTKIHDDKSESFWHVTSLDQSDSNSFRILPCINDVSEIQCSGNCQYKVHQVTLKKGAIRDICYYRGIRIRWISKIIELANNNDTNVKIWKKGLMLHIRFEHETADYIILLLESHVKGVFKNYYFVSAFPIFYLNSKRNFEADYQRFITQGRTLPISP